MHGNASLRNNMVPLASECVSADLPIQGELSRDLNGTLFRNGPNPKFPVASEHWFTGDGMVHAFTLSDGRESYRNRRPGQTQSRRWCSTTSQASFPRIDDRRSGLRHRFGAIAGRSRPGAGLDSLVWLDLAQRSRSCFTLPEGDGFSEPVFVPRREDAVEGDGWLLATVWRAAEERSDVAVFDTADLTHGPVATIRLPHRVPAGFRGNWVANAA